MNKLRVLIADDHKMIRDGLKGVIHAEPDMEVVGEADDGQEAWQKAKELQPDVVIMDVSMPKLDGVKATERLKRECPHVKVIALTAYDGNGYINRLLQAGASGYVLKIAAAEELINAIRIVAAGDSYLDKTLTSKVLEGYIRQKSSIPSADRDTLTEREEEVLRLVAQGFINKEIAAKLNLSVKTVESHKSNFMQKLGLHSRAEVVRYALSQGWLDT
jgi:DNA-binding NarL/FixJ family response regulator